MLAMAGWIRRQIKVSGCLPHSRGAGRRSQWVSNDTLRDAAKAMQAKHLLVVADSCFSGALTRSVVMDSADRANYFQRMADKKARLALSSGGLEPVADSGGSGHSPFAIAFIRALQNNRQVLDGSSLFAEIRRRVALNADQTPEYSDIRKAGHDGGDYLFVRSKTNMASNETRN